MSHFNEPNGGAAAQKLQIWMCQGCQAVHFKTGNVMLNFTKAEFAELAEAIVDVYSQEFGGLEFYRMLRTLNQKEDEVLLSETIV
jgi:hypothetical protein